MFVSFPFIYPFGQKRRRQDSNPQPLDCMTNALSNRATSPCILVFFRIYVASLCLAFSLCYRSRCFSPFVPSILESSLVIVWMFYFLQSSACFLASVDASLSVEVWYVCATDPPQHLQKECWGTHTPLRYTGPQSSGPCLLLNAGGGYSTVPGGYMPCCVDMETVGSAEVVTLGLVVRFGA